MENNADEILIFGLDNALIDMSLVLQDDRLLAKYDLRIGEAHLAEKKHLPLYQELWKMKDVKTIPGGSCLNTIRAANFMLKLSHPGKCAFFSGIGKDQFGERLENLLQEQGIMANFHKDDHVPTGTCAVLIKDEYITYYANVGACQQYPLSHLQENIDLVRRSKLLYTASYFITSNYEAMRELGQVAVEMNKPLGFNLTGASWIQDNLGQINTMLKYADFSICNEEEAQKFAEVNDIHYDNLKTVALHIQKWEKFNDKRSRVAMITRGEKPVIVARQMENGEVAVQEFQVLAVPKDKIVDLNGAGDAFVGGFLSQLALDKPLEVCIAAGIYLAGESIQKSGCQMPDQNKFSP